MERKYLEYIWRLGSQVGETQQFCVWIPIKSTHKWPNPTCMQHIALNIAYLDGFHIVGVAVICSFLPCFPPHPRFSPCKPRWRSFFLSLSHFWKDSFGFFFESHLNLLNSSFPKWFLTLNREIRLGLVYW